MDIRARLLPHDDRVVALAQSALDRSWLDRIDSDNGVFITAEGLLMYLQPEDALALIADCAQRFPGGATMFDSIPPWFSALTMRGLRLTRRYTAPPMPFPLTADQGVALATKVPGVRRARDIVLPPGRGLVATIGLRLADRGVLHRLRPSITLLEFG
ncbi:O-methyltransferase involved in polyketide biosynthesis [Mycolicibacterium phlei]|jgi:O-methyltransferase involved in polyketide biosynthesis|nr:Leucine carboxyl methyltransferase [Mycolicibacterium phlei]KXW66653.1 hypothetical protein MPHL43070_20775 [Mycolicibacterium phlei DSM 43070]KXW66854.1 hypothetical protein MPHL43072_24270 [Mycolicibacterium phlei DSM 43072]VEG09597.1 O-methyltransferase involved in polyketide biosynthesis [Mycobacteroides chelonae]MBF4195576.1 O-methyltransferase involved in polyketide biosynthesis [Mycolicibacterium phlei]